MHNPYEAPGSALQAVSVRRASRPLAVWSLAFLLAALALFWTVGLIGLLAAIVTGKTGNVALLFPISLQVFQLAVVVTAVAGMLRRRQWGRWLGLLAIGGFTVLMILRPDTTYYANSAEQTGGFLGRNIIVPLLMLWWGRRFGFSDKAKQYFAGAPHAS